MNRFIAIIEHLRNKKNAWALAFFCLFLWGGFAGMARAGINQWTPIGPEGGTIHTLAIDPANPAILYAVTSFYGSVFKSIDGGAHWQAVNTGLTSGELRPLAIDPLTPATVYVGTLSGGVFKSTDGGATWQAINTGLTHLDISWALAIDPLHPATVYAGTWGGGVFKSIDGGAHWEAVNTGLTDLYVRTLAIDPLHPATLYAGTGAGGGVFKSIDGGVHWQAVNTGLINRLVLAWRLTRKTQRRFLPGPLVTAYSKLPLRMTPIATACPTTSRSPMGSTRMIRAMPDWIQPA